jgi:hypothetical protein
VYVQSVSIKAHTIYNRVLIVARAPHMFRWTTNNHLWLALHVQLNYQ